MIKQIYRQRYGKITLSVVVVILLYFCGAGYSAVHNWHTNQKWLHSDDFREEYREYPSEYYTYDGEGNAITHYYDLATYIEEQSYFWKSYDMSEGPSYRTIDELREQMKPANFDPKLETYSSYQETLGQVVIGLIALCGFLLFFVDQKTAFNRFLFSLPVSRKKLFMNKLIQVGLPILGSFLVGSILNVVILHLGVPQPYMNASWGQLLASVGTSFSTCLLGFSVSVFVGTMVGNIVFGPLAYLLLLASGTQLPYVLFNLMDTLNILLRGKSANYSNSYFRIFTWDIGKSSGYWQAALVMVVVSGALLFWAYRKYQVLSLENDGEFLLYPESRWPVWFLLTGYTFIILLFSFTNTWHTYLYAQRIDNSYWSYPLREVIVSMIIQLLIAIALSTSLLFFGGIRKFLQEKWDAHLAKKALKGGS